MRVPDNVPGRGRKPGGGLDVEAFQHCLHVMVIVRQRTDDLGVGGKHHQRQAMAAAALEGVGQIQQGLPSAVEACRGSVRRFHALAHVQHDDHVPASDNLGVAGRGPSGAASPAASAERCAGQGE